MTDVPPLPRSFSRSDLETSGFLGWRTWAALRANDLADVPVCPAVYVVYRPAVGPPSFLPVSPGGHFKGKDPTVPAVELHANWVADSNVIYIGKADAARSRLKQFAKFGAGQKIGHWGGRFIWQLADSAEQLVAWHVISWDEEAKASRNGCSLTSRHCTAASGRSPTSPADWLASAECSAPVPPPGRQVNPRRGSRTASA